MATTTSTENSGLLAIIIPSFEKMFKGGCTGRHDDGGRRAGAEVALGDGRLVVQPQESSHRRRAASASRPGWIPTTRRGRPCKVALSESATGHYRVSWQALPASGGSARNDSFRFAVGMPLPESAAGGELEDHVAGERKKRKTVVGGLALLLLGAALPHLSRRP